ncbi:DsrE family protein [Roseomonas sp. PWR1]|uniref:DsrE family protein n=1 Tax=Roseomonas nitratireducens TaxID=2820810 RepID=A0ABS4B051_9PROT|nr:DsrE family protein [Neoroseomonas nitratireducens]MBP0466927.1 DsrE family protein [Neoroseomonas nitratireducens]
MSAHPKRLGVLLESGGHARAHYALVVAAGAAALGREVTLFATNLGCLLLAEPCPLLADAREAAIAGRGVAGIGTLLAACAEMGVRRIACEAGLKAEGLAGMALAPGVEVAGIATFLDAVGDGPIVTL